MGPDTVRTLRVWQERMILVKESYALIAAWPKSELFGLTGQIRRAAVSIPCNLAEGKGRGSAAELVRFARIALGSAYELDTLLEIATELDFGAEAEILAVRDRLSALCASFLPTSNPGGASFSYDPHPTSHNPSC